MNWEQIIDSDGRIVLYSSCEAISFKIVVHQNDRSYKAFANNVQVLGTRDLETAILFCYDLLNKTQE